MNQPKRVGIWIRVSTDMQVQGDSPEHHEQRARYYVEAKGWTVVEVYRLEAISGKSVMGHPETKRMLADIKSGHINGLVFSKLARLARNTKELLEFSELFRAANADLISLAESIDTSTPAGRLFYTIIAAMAEWERDEISARVQASVPVRARLGKSLGGAAPFGYRWEGNTFSADPTEAPVRALMYELFVQHQRKQTVAKALNSLGYRTRNNALFTATTIHRLLRDSTANGERRANYTKSTGENKNWILKPKEEWIIIPCEAIVSPELWEQCNRILDEQEHKRAPTAKKAVYLLSGFVHCSCGRKMYVFQNSQNYACKTCKRRIAVEDLDEIYQIHLKEYLNSINPVEYLSRSDEQLQAQKALLASTQKEHAKLAKRISDMVAMRLDGEMSKEQFAEQYKPLETRVAQLDLQLPELEADIDVRTIQLNSTDVVMSEAKALYEQWGGMPYEQKRTIVEMITSRIELDREDITITLAYAPVIAEKGSHRHMGSCSRQA
jgi:site-specific DNA recombinase